MTDRLDDELQRLRLDLHAEAVASAHSAATLADLRNGHHPSPPPSRVRRDHRAIVGACLLMAASLVAVAIVGGTGHRSTIAGTLHDTAPGNVDTSATSITSTTIPSTVTPSRTDATIADASNVWFDDARVGFAVVDNGPGVDVFGTADGGSTWQSVGTITDSATAGALTFADASNGWMATDAGLWSTHDGGHSWHQLADPPLGVFPQRVSVTATGGTVYAVGFSTAPDGRFNLYASPVTSDDFRPTGISFEQGAAPVASFSIAGHDDKVWVIYNDRVFGGGGRRVGGTVDSKWTPPAADKGGPIEVVTARDGGPIYTFGQTGVWTDVAKANVVSVSDDGGTTFRLVPLPPVSGLGDQPDQVEIVPIDAHTVGAVVTASDGSSTTLYDSTDEGATWNAVGPLTVSDVRFVDTTTAIGTATTTEGLTTAMRSTDGGRTWVPLGQVKTAAAAPSTTLPPADSYDIGASSFLGTGRGWLVATNHAGQVATLFRTDDLGRHWQVVPTAGIPATAHIFGVVFANPNDGWLWGDGWWSTHDGGATWHALPASDAGYTPNQVFVRGDFAYALGGFTPPPPSTDFVYRLLRSPIGVDDFVETGLAWKKGAGGNNLSPLTRERGRPLDRRSGQHGLRRLQRPGRADRPHPEHRRRPGVATRRRGTRRQHRPHRRPRRRHPVPHDSDRPVGWGRHAAVDRGGVGRRRQQPLSVDASPGADEGGQSPAVLRAQSTGAWNRRDPRLRCQWNGTHHLGR
jgi:photosystem II stability/assembly factor-like uncharacterized protein